MAGMMLVSASALAQMKYPQTKKIDHVDNYHGTQVADPYRWLEDDNSEETKAWVKAQNEVSFGYLNQIPLRDEFKKRIEALSNYEKISAPSRKGEWYYFYKNSGLQNQSVLYRQKGLNGKPELVIDPNTLSKEGTTRLTVFALDNSDTTANNGSVWSFRTSTTGTGAASFVEMAALRSVNEVHDNATATARLDFFTMGSGSLTQKATILGNGNFGIGMTNPARTLEIGRAHV